MTITSQNLRGHGPHQGASNKRALTEFTFTFILILNEVTRGRLCSKISTSYFSVDGFSVVYGIVKHPLIYLILQN